MFAIALQFHAAARTQDLLTFSNGFEHHEQTPLLLRNGDDGAIPTGDLSKSPGIWE
jgi:hypothetical protein